MGLVSCNPLIAADPFNPTESVSMLRLICLALLLATTPAVAGAQTVPAPPEEIPTWTLADGKTINALFVANDGDQVTMLVRNTVPIKIFDAKSKARIAQLAALSPQQLTERPAKPEPWTSANGKVVSAIFDSVQGENVSFLVQKKIALSSLSEESRLQLEQASSDDSLPSMLIPEVEIPELSLTLEPTVSIDLSKEPDVMIDFKNDSTVLLELDKYVNEASPSETEPEVDTYSTQPIVGPTPSDLAAIARQKKRAEASQRLIRFLDEFKVLYAERGDSQIPDPAWKKRYDNYLDTIDRFRKVDHDDLIAYSTLALAAAALERGDEPAVVASLLMLSEFLLDSR
tara:strand:- start:55246 stop:56274 length:1029 start_codon:yes stop_codon:yes gene_type:complete